MNYEYVCSQMVQILHCDICCMKEDGDIIRCFGSHSEQANPVAADHEFRRRILARERKEFPDLFHEKDCILYAVFAWEDLKIVAGPVCIERPGHALNQYMIEEHHIDGKAEFRLTYCEMKVFGAGVLMLHHILSGEELTLDELRRRNQLNDLDITDIQSNVSEVIFQRQENGMPHNPYDQELREMESIRRGDVEMLRKSMDEIYRGEVGKLAKNEIRHTKNLAICVIVLASRAAIEGGMLPEEAFSMVDGYILEIEEMNHILKIGALMRQAEFDFAKAVHGIRKDKEKNELIERTKNYIFQNLHSNIVIGEIGKEIGANSSYLSDLFHRVEGMTIQQYIRRKKISLAENMLRYSDYDGKEIANYLSFCSQSHFGHIFKEQTGMSPKQYRKKYGKHK